MRNLIFTFVLIAATSMLSAAQAGSTAQPAAKAPAAKAVSPASAEPVAIIHTSVGDLHCTLFSKQAPIGVANFIGPAPSLTPRSTAFRFMMAPCFTESFPIS